MKTLIATLAALAAMPAAAHVHLHPEQAAAGQTVEIALQVGHGCAGAATTALRVAVPEGLTVVQAAPKQGWNVATVAAVPAGRVTEVHWTGGELSDHDKGSFAFTVSVAGAGGDLALPVVQVCGGHEVRWIETGAKSEHPAPVLKVAPGA